MRAVRIGIAFRVQTHTQRLQLDLTRDKQQQRLAGARLVQHCIFSLWSSSRQPNANPCHSRSRI